MHQDVAVIDAIVVVDDADETVGRLLAVWIGNAEPLVEHEAAAPSLAIVFGKVSGQMRAAGARIERAVFDEQQISRHKPADEKARRSVQDARRLQFRPCPATVRAHAFADAVGGADEQPE